MYVSALPNVGIYLYPLRNTELHAIRENLQLLDAVFFEGDFNDGLGPDLAFVRFTDKKKSEIEKHSVFLNLNRNEEKIAAGPPEGSTSVSDAVVGGVYELGQRINEYGDRKAIIQNSLFN